MSKGNTKIIFLWHMHQPYYKHPDTGDYVLPWVRLHGAKDYYGMAKIIEKFEKIKAVFSFSGVLLEQLLDYTFNFTRDYWLELTLKDPAYLKKEEKDFIVERFFSVNFERFVRPSRRYLELYNKKLSSQKKFTSQEIGDLQALFNLCWFHPYTFNRDKNLSALVRKGRNYTKEDKNYIVKKQYEAIAQIIPLLKQLLSRKRIEITVAPYAHPIMPLLYSTDILKDYPHLKMPKHKFSSHHDCHWHLKKSKDIFKGIFGGSPAGSWPPEGGVSTEVISLYKKEGFSWIATDESILFKSLATDYLPYEIVKNQRHLIYRPHKFGGVNLFFRDKNLSNGISFIYQGWDDHSVAAQDLLQRFKRIHGSTKSLFSPRAITIALDGENAWEYYKNNGVDFLEAVYSQIEKSSTFSTVTAEEFLSRCKSKKLERLASGSWANGDFGIWIGSKKNNFYWAILKRLKDLIEKSRLTDDKLEEARKYLYFLEGSDWFWWNSFEDLSGEFKKIFFSYVKKIFSLLGKKVPSYAAN